MRSTILTAADRLLAQSPTGEVSTRAVCAAAGVRQPTLYRIFGDKAGLLAAVVDQGFERYLASKREAVPSADPVTDLRAGWDNHIAFALAQPHLYRLMFLPGRGVEPAAVAESHALLRGVLERCARVGALRLPVPAATQVVMAANTGLALALVTRPELYPDPALSPLLREIVLAGVLADAVPATLADGRTASAAVALGSLLRITPPDSMTPGEVGLLAEWMDRLARAA